LLLPSFPLEITTSSSSIPHLFSFFHLLLALKKKQSRKAVGAIGTDFI
jgi:hypothetical protein